MLLNLSTKNSCQVSGSTKIFIDKENLTQDRLWPHSRFLQSGFGFNFNNLFFQSTRIYDKGIQNSQPAIVCLALKVVVRNKNVMITQKKKYLMSKEYNWLALIIYFKAIQIYQLQNYCIIHKEPKSPFRLNLTLQNYLKMHFTIHELLHMCSFIKYFKCNNIKNTINL